MIANNEFSDADMYIKVVKNDEIPELGSKKELAKFLNHKTCNWKANKYGNKRLDLIDNTFPLNSRFYICAEPYRSEVVNDFTLKIDIRPAKPVIPLQSGVIYDLKVSKTAFCHY